MVLGNLMEFIHSVELARQVECVSHVLIVSRSSPLALPGGVHGGGGVEQIGGAQLGGLVDINLARRAWSWTCTAGLGVLDRVQYVRAADALGRRQSPARLNINLISFSYFLLRRHHMPGYAAPHAGVCGTTCRGGL